MHHGLTQYYNKNKSNMESEKSLKGHLLGICAKEWQVRAAELTSLYWAALSAARSLDLAAFISSLRPGSHRGDALRATCL